MGSIFAILLSFAVFFSALSVADSTFTPNTQVIWDYAISPTPRYRVDPKRILISPHSFSLTEAATILHELAADPNAQLVEASGRNFREQQSERIWREILKSNEFDFEVFEKFTSQYELLLRQLQRLEGRETVLRRLMAEQTAQQEIGIFNREILEKPQNLDLRMSWQRGVRQELTRSSILPASMSQEQIRVLEEWRMTQLQLLKKCLVDSVRSALSVRLNTFNDWLILSPAKPGALLRDDVRSNNGVRLTITHLRQMELVYVPMLRNLDLSSRPKSGMAPMVSEWLLRDQSGRHFALVTPSMASIVVTKDGSYVSQAFADHWYSVDHPDDFSKIDMQSIHKAWTLEMANSLIGNLHTLIDGLEDLNLQASLPHIKNRMRELLWRIQQNSPRPENLRESEFNGGRRPEMRRLMDTLVNWRWWGLAKSESHWSERAQEANRKKLPVLEWKGSQAGDLGNSTGPSGHLAAEISEDLANSPEDQSGYAFSVERDLFSELPPKYFNYPGIGSEHTGEKIALQSDTKGNLFLRSLIPSLVARDGRFPIPTPEGFELTRLTVRKSMALDSSEMNVQILRTPRGYQAQLTDEKVTEVFLEAEFRDKSAPKESGDELLLKLPWERLQRVAEKMRNSPLKTLSAALDHFLTNGRIVSAQDLADLIAEHSLYSYYPSPTLKGKFDSLNELAGFLNSNGTLCIQCNVAAALLADWLREVWAGVEGIEVRVVTVLAYQDGSLRRAPHAVVEVRKNGVRLALLDSTPSSLDPRAPMPLSALQYQSISSSESNLDYAVEMLENARASLVKKAEFFTPHRIDVFEPHSEFVRLNVTAAAVIDWTRNNLSYQDFLKKSGANSLAEIETQVESMAASSKRWTENIPGRLTQKEQTVRDFHRGIQPEVEQVAKSLTRVLTTLQKSKACESAVH